MDGALRNWQYLFIIEGALTCFFGILAWFWLPMGPGSAWFLSEEDRRFAANRMHEDSAAFVQHSYGKDGLEKDRLTKLDVAEALLDWKLWYVLVFNICASVPGQAFSVFLPLVVNGLGYTALTANLVSVLERGRSLLLTAGRCPFRRMCVAPSAYTCLRLALIEGQLIQQDSKKIVNIWQTRTGVPYHLWACHMPGWPYHYRYRREERCQIRWLVHFIVRKLCVGSSDRCLVEW